MASDHIQSESYQPQSQAATLSAASRQSFFSRFCSNIVFLQPGVRLGLELSAVVIFYGWLRESPIWTTLGFTVSRGHIVAWFVACALVIIADHICFVRALMIFRRVYRFDYQGNTLESLKTLESIGPESHRFLRCPRLTYHVLRVEIFAHARRREEALQELEIARQAGLHLQSYFLLKNEIFKHAGEFLEASDELHRAKIILGERPQIILEQAILGVESREDWRMARKNLAKVIAMPDDLHPSGETTKRIARAYHEVTRLWTGEAEEGLDRLNRVIKDLRDSINLVETIRPVLASLVLERAYYFATHQEPKSAVSDLRLGLEYCSLPRHCRLAEKTSDELESRFPSRLLELAKAIPQSNS